MRNSQAKLELINVLIELILGKSLNSENARKNQVDHQNHNRTHVSEAIKPNNIDITCVDND